jgi:DNA helicase-2/ATP-dependent DNA helicase PcrA
MSNLEEIASSPIAPIPAGPLAPRRYALKTSALPVKGLVDYDTLNDEQRDVALAPEGPTLVIAGAGSGKTRALTYRVARLLETGTPPERILLLTFTNRASREMMSRVESLCRVDLRKLLGGTFHHVAHSILRDHASSLGYRDRFALLDREDSKELMSAATADLGLGVGTRRFPRADVLVDVWSRAVNTQKPIAEVLAESHPQFLAIEEPILSVCRRYAERKSEMNAMDFDDLLLNWQRLLLEVPEVARLLRARFSAVLVDEYQDTNHLQGRIVDELSRDHRNILVVGDDAQSIFGFRGARFENILEFPDRWPGCQTRKLSVNYRSTPQIVALANHSIRNNRKQFPKELRANRDTGVMPALVPLRDVQQQAEFVAQRILELREEGIALKDMAVLYRAHHHSMELQMELLRRGIPFLVRSGVRFFEQAHIKDVLAFLRFIANPRDELSFKRIVKLSPGIGAASADALWARLSEAARRGENAHAVLGNDRLDELLPAKARPGFRTLRKGLSQLALPSMKESPSEMISFVLEEAGYREALKVRFANADARADDVRQLADYALQAESLEQFLADLTLLDTLESEDVIEGADADEKVALSSIHQAKGLEWRAVFMVWLADGRFPSAPALRDPDGEEEERRLFYVGATRARDELYLCYPMMHEERDRARILMKPSRFLDELPAQPGCPYEKWSIEPEPVAAAPRLPSGF